MSNKLATLVNSFDTISYNFGISKPSDNETPVRKIDFEFNYFGDVPLLGVKASCGCTDVRIEGNTVKGKLSLNRKENYGHHTHVIDADGVIWQIKGKFGVDVAGKKKPQPLEAINGQPLPSETKNITVYFKDGEEFMSVDEQGKITDNTKKLSVQLTITGFVDIR